MTPQPVVLSPIFKSKPWGGRRLAKLGKSLPPDESIGESWEVADLPGNESRVARGPLMGRSIRELMDAWGAALLGDAAPADGRFPLLVKFLDAADNLSVQVHPKPPAHDPAGWTPGIKHECWYVVDAAPGAELLIGLRDGVTAADVAAAANTPRIIDLLQRRPARRGDCYYLPSGTLHALGGGVMVAEVQTPSDVTYRIYDWDRVDAAGRPRELHVDESLANIRHDVEEHEIDHINALRCGALKPQSESGREENARKDGVAFDALVRCSRFELDRIVLPAGGEMTLPDQMHVAILIAGAIRISSSAGVIEATHGETTLIPAAVVARVTALESTELLIAGAAPIPGGD